jgi:hypothetical protein
VTKAAPAGYFTGTVQMEGATPIMLNQETLY